MDKLMNPLPDSKGERASLPGAPYGMCERWSSALRDTACTRKILGVGSAECLQ